MLNCMSCLQILDINLLLVISFANISLHILSCLFVNDFICCAKVFKSDKVNIGFFCFYYFRERSKNILLQFLSEYYAYVFL